MRRALITAVMFAGACGGRGPMAPSTTVPQPAMSLDTGAYVLTVSMATSGTSGFSSCVSLTIGPPPPALTGVFVPTPVHLERTGNSATIAPDDPSATFRMQLQLSGATLSGTASGQYRSSATTVTVNGPLSAPTGPALATGIVGPSSITGALDGSVSVGDMTCTNNGHGWSLMTR